MSVLDELQHEQDKVERRIMNGHCTSYEDYLASCSNFKTLVSCRDYIERSRQESVSEGWAEEEMGDE